MENVGHSEEGNFRIEELGHFWGKKSKNRTENGKILDMRTQRRSKSPFYLVFILESLKVSEGMISNSCSQKVVIPFGTPRAHLRLQVKRINLQTVTETDMKFYDAP